MRNTQPLNHHACLYSLHQTAVSALHRCRKFVYGIRVINKNESFAFLSRKQTVCCICKLRKFDYRLHEFYITQWVSYIKVKNSIPTASGCPSEAPFPMTGRYFNPPHSNRASCARVCRGRPAASKLPPRVTFLRPCNGPANNCLKSPESRQLNKSNRERLRQQRSRSNWQVRVRGGPQVCFLNRKTTHLNKAPIMRTGAGRMRSVRLLAETVAQTISDLRYAISSWQIRMIRRRSVSARHAGLGDRPECQTGRSRQVSAPPGRHCCVAV